MLYVKSVCKDNDFFKTCKTDYCFYLKIFLKTFSIKGNILLFRAFIAAKKKLICQLTNELVKVTPFGFEPKTYSLEVNCSIQLSYGAKKSSFKLKKKRGMISHPPCRGGRIRTCDLLVPNQAR